MAPSSLAYVVGTCDTKGVELCYVRDQLERLGLSTVLVDLSVGSGREAAMTADIPPATVAAFHPDGAAAVLARRNRGLAVQAMALAFERFVASRTDIGGMIGLGGSGGTAIITPAMRLLPLGVPKVMVSTKASGNVRPYVGGADICMLYSVTDILGINSVSAYVLTNGANALAGMMRFAKPSIPRSKPSVGLTMFGVTTPAVMRIVEALRDRSDCLPFHATGVGGQSMELMIDRGEIHASIDITTTEVCDLLLGGLQPAHPDRFGAIARTRIPYVVSCGALDMVNFGPPDTVPAHYRHRHLHAHNAHVTLMRTTADENARMGEWIGARLNACTGPVRLLLPLGGISAIDAPGEPFHDPEADEALFASLRRTVETTELRQVIEVPHHINDPEFSAAAVTQFLAICSPRG